MGTSLFRQVVQALYIGTGFLWTAAWAIFLNLMITSWVQVYVSKEKLAGYMGSARLKDLSWSTVFGALSSGCSFGATVIGKGLFKKGAHPMNVLAFMFASTNLIVELGLMIWTALLLLFKRVHEAVPQGSREIHRAGDAGGRMKTARKRATPHRHVPGGLTNHGDRR